MFGDVRCWPENVRSLSAPHPQAQTRETCGGKRPALTPEAMTRKFSEMFGAGPERFAIGTRPSHVASRCLSPNDGAAVASTPPLRVRSTSQQPRWCPRVRESESSASGVCTPPVRRTPHGSANGLPGFTEIISGWTRESEREREIHSEGFPAKKNHVLKISPRWSRRRRCRRRLDLPTPFGRLCHDA